MRTYLIRVLSIVGLACLSFLGHADITSVSVVPSALVVNINTGLNANLTWTVTLSESNALSRQAEFFVQNSEGAFETVNTALSVVAPTNSPPQPVMVSESLVISQAQAQLWWSLGVRELFYGRTFEDGNGSRGTADLVLTFTNETGGVVSGPADQKQGLNKLRTPASGLDIHRLELRFTDLKTLSFVDSGDTLHAQLDVSYSGFGVLRGQWQIADSASVSGQPQFRTLSLVNEQLSPAQNDKVLSPALPTALEGNYYLRFCVTALGDITAPVSGASACPTEIISTVVGYQVFPPKPAIPVLVGLSPSGVAASSSTLFRWPSVLQAAVNQIQILSATDSDGSSPNPSENPLSHTFITGMLLPGNVTEVRLSDYVTEQLVSGRSYYWRIFSYGNDGRLLAQSELVGFRFVDRK